MTHDGGLDLDASLSRTSLADAAYETLLGAIIKGRLRSGTELTTVALARELSVSRTPVQEALRRLAADGFVEWARGREPRVARFGPQDLREIYDMRRILEGAAAFEAAASITDAALVELRRRANGLAASTGEAGWGERALDYDVHFHDVIARAAGNRRLHADITRYRNLVRAFCRATGSDENLRRAFQEHVRILEALEARDPGAARQAMEAHVAVRMEAVLRELPDGSVSPAAPSART